jgi:hypothetical protein
MSAEKNNINEVKKVIQNVRASWWEDGLVEIISGIVFILVAGLLSVMEFVSNQNLQTILVIVFVSVMIALAILGRWFKRALKKKYVWQKTGYSKPGIGRMSSLAYIFAFTLLIFYVGLSLHIFLRYKSIGQIPGGITSFYFLSTKSNWFFASFIGIFIFFVYLAVYLASGLKRFLLTGLLALVSGVTCAFFSGNELTIAITILVIIGIYSLLNGIPRFLRFRKSNIRRYDECV